MDLISTRLDNVLSIIESHINSEDASIPQTLDALQLNVHETMILKWASYLDKLEVRKDGQQNKYITLGMLKAWADYPPVDPLRTGSNDRLVPIAGASEESIKWDEFTPVMGDDDGLFDFDAPDDYVPAARGHGSHLASSSQGIGHTQGQRRAGIASLIPRNAQEIPAEDAASKRRKAAKDRQAAEKGRQQYGSKGKGKGRA